jgi:putative redox protein
MDMKIVFPGGKRVNALYKDFTIETDQSLQGGGEGTVPEPFDLFFASMGTCAGIYVLSFCQHHDLSSEGITLFQTAERDPDSKMFMKLRIDIRVPESFPEKYRMALVRSAEQCTVKKHIALGLPEFEVAVVVEPQEH